jgi:hypothetical protein
MPPSQQGHKVQIFVISHEKYRWQHHAYAIPTTMHLKIVADPNQTPYYILLLSSKLKINSAV